MKTTLAASIALLAAMAGVVRPLAKADYVPVPQSTPFTPACTLPFEAIKQHHPIDDACDSSGEGGPNAKLQNAMKNNFCSSGAPRTVTVAGFRQIQAQSGGFAAGCPSCPAADRSIYNVTVPSLGSAWKEGDLVRLVGWVIDAHISNGDSGGENVNCNHNGESWNDLHIAVAQSKSEDDLCNAVVVEMSPHFRPAAWMEITHFGKTRPMRFTGSLLFDANHGACEGAVRSKPPRLSSWEIHPIYKAEVCKHKSIAGCSAANDSLWMPFDEWVGSEEDGGQ